MKGDSAMIRAKKSLTLQEVLASVNDEFKASEQPDFKNTQGTEKSVNPPDNMVMRTPTLQGKVAAKERQVAEDAANRVNPDDVKTLDLNSLYTTMAYLKDDPKENHLNRVVDPSDWAYSRRGEDVIALYEEELRKSFPAFANKLVANLGQDVSAWMMIFNQASNPAWFKSLPYPTECLVELAQLMKNNAPANVKVPPYVQALAKMTDYAVSTLR